MRLRPGLLVDEDEEDRRIDRSAPDEQPEVEPVSVGWRLIAAVTAAAAVPRILYLFVFTDPENGGDPFTDAYHHWQIAYLTKEVGLAQGRLWDMRGWEYFWGALHPLVVDLAFFVSGSVDIVVARVVSLIFGAFAVALIFALCHRYWGMHVAVAAGAFAALSPISIFNDVALMLLGIWLAPRRGFMAGVSWGLAAMARVEAWLFSAGLVVASLIGGGTRRSRFPLVAGWVLTMGVYMKFLVDRTGNPIYPLYTNFQFVGQGAGGTAPTLDAQQQALSLPLLAATALCVVGLGWTLWRRPSSYLLLTYGFGYSALSFATYLRYATEWKERRFELPLDFMAILAAVLLLHVLPRRSRALRAPDWGLAAVGLLAVQVTWLPIQSAYDATQPLFDYEVVLAADIGAVYNEPAYRGATLNMPGDEPTLLYLLARNEGVRGDRIVSQFYDPFYYLPGGYHYSDHKEVVGPLLQCWLAKTGTRLMLLPPPGPISQSVPEYLAFIADHPEWFDHVGGVLGNGWTMIDVHVATPAPGVCDAAARAAP
jgi:hypothetical protein